MLWNVVKIYYEIDTLTVKVDVIRDVRLAVIRDANILGLSPES